MYCCSVLRKTESKASKPRSRDSGSDSSASDSEFDYSNSELEEELEPIESSASKCLKVCMSGKNMFP